MVGGGRWAVAPYVWSTLDINVNGAAKLIEKLLK